jgi:PhnB protein
MAVYPFLSFNGNCQDAMRFYQACFGGRLRLQFLADAPDRGAIPRELANLIVSATLESEHIRLFATDLMEEEGIFNGNRVSLLFSSFQVDYLQSSFTRLAENGTISGPFTNNIMAGEWSSLTDQYGVQWIFCCQP